MNALIAILVACIAVALLALILAYILGWPLWRVDKRKMARYLTQCGDRLVEMRGRWWPEWERVPTTLKWVPVRVYTVCYIDRSGRQHQALGRFYPPWWLMPTFESAYDSDFDLIEL